MGCSASSEDNERRKAQRTLKVVVLGTASSGKSTFFKQMKIINSGGFEDSEYDNFLRIIRSNFYMGLKELIEAAQESGADVEGIENLIEYFKEISPSGKEAISEKCVKYGKKLWKSEVIQEIWEQRDDFPNFTIINLDYIMNNLDRIAGDDCELTTDDIVRVRQRTTGISNFEFPVEKYFINLVDVGGQKTERRKWSLVAQNPTAIVFFTSINEFDVDLPGSEQTKFEESLEVWKQILEDDIFENATCLLFLNKSDLLEEKLERVQLADTFEEYEGDNSPESAAEYIKDIFLEHAEGTFHDPEKIYPHVTCAIDTDFIGKIFDSLISEIFAQRLAKSGFAL